MRIISLLVPGGAQFLTGRALSGAAYLAVVSLLGLILVAGSTLVPGVGWDALTPPLVAIASTVCGLVYMAAQIDTWVST